MKKKQTPREDGSVEPIPKIDSLKAQDEFQSGSYLCTCVECGSVFIGREESYLCIHCINEYY
jgi:hypothetical protein